MLVQGKKLQGISDVKDLTDMANGLRLVIEVKNGFHPEAILEQLYKLTPMEESFGINNVSLVDGQPRTLGLKELLEVFLEHRYDVVRRRSPFRRDKKAERLHLVDGLLIAILDIDEVIQVIRTSDDAAAARERLMSVFDLTEIAGQLHPRHAAAPADQVQPDRAREGAGRRCAARSRSSTRSSADEALLRKVVSDELGRGRQDLRHPAPHGPARVGGQPPTAAARRSRSPTTPASCSCRPPACSPARRRDEPLGDGGGRANHDVVVSAVRHHRPRRGRRGHLAGRLIKLGVLDLPALPGTANAPATSRAARRSASSSRSSPASGSLALTGSAPTGPGSRSAPARASSSGSTPRCLCNRDDWEVIRLDDGDEVVGAVELPPATRRSASSPPTPSCCTSARQRCGRRAAPAAASPASGSPRARGSVWFGALDAASTTSWSTASGSSTALPGTEPGAVKVTPFSEYPAKGRATGGVRCHRFLKGEDTLVAGVGRRRAGPGGGRQRRAGRPARADRQARRLRYAGQPADRRCRRSRRSPAGPLRARQRDRRVRG